MTSGEARLEAAAVQAIVEYAARTDPFRVEHTVQVTSFGGSGTTTLCQHLLDAGVDLQKGPAQWPFKHHRTPPSAAEVPPGFRAVYLLGDPRDAVLSVFRRRRQLAHYRALQHRAPDTAAAQRLVALEGFVAAGVDDFELADHVRRWQEHEPGYSVLFVRYDALAQVWGQVADFVGLPQDAPAWATRPRRSDWRSLPSPVREQLDAMYGELAERIAALPPARLA